MSQGGNISTSSPSVTSSNKLITLTDDFFDAGNYIALAPTSIGQLNWDIQGTQGMVPIAGTATHPGLVQVTNNVVSFLALTDDSNAYGALILGGGIVTFNFVLSLVTLSAIANRYTIYVGLGNPILGGSPTGAAPTNGVFFSYIDNANSGNWLTNCTSSSSNSHSDSGVAAITGFVNLGFQVNAAASSVQFMIDGSPVGTPITTNIPSTAIFPFIMLHRSSGALPAALIDYFQMTINLTTAR